MEYQMEIEEHAGQKMLHTTIHGELAEAERNRIGAEAFEMMNMNNISKSIWDVRESVLKTSLTKVHMDALSFESFSLAKGKYVAIIYKHNEREFVHAQSLSHSVGIDNVEYFQDMDEGIQWLVGKGVRS
jgi:hypothetical protein